MRALKLTFLSLTALLALCSPALAQSPVASQYEDCPESTLENVEAGCILSIGDGVDDFASNTGQGTASVNDALTEPVSSAAASTASPASTSAPGETAVSENSKKAEDDKVEQDEGVGRDEGLASITALPETGGPSLAVLGSGALLVALGLLIRRTTDR